MMMILIWETKEDVKTKQTAYHKKMKPVKLNGRKPNRIIMHDSDNNTTNQKHLKKLVSHDGLIITNTGVPIYDKQHGIV